MSSTTTESEGKMQIGIRKTLMATLCERAPPSPSYANECSDVA